MQTSRWYFCQVFLHSDGHSGSISGIQTVTSYIQIARHTDMQTGLQTDTRTGLQISRLPFRHPDWSQTGISKALKANLHTSGRPLQAYRQVPRLTFRQHYMEISCHQERSPDCTYDRSPYIKMELPTGIQPDLPTAIHTSRHPFGHVSRRTSRPISI